MIASRIFFVLLAGLLCGFTSTATAEVVISINFNGDTPGQPPAVNPIPGVPMTQPSAIGGYGPAGSILVGAAPGMAQGVIMTSNPTNNVLGAQYVDVNGFSLTGQQVRVSFDVNVLNAPTDATAQPKILGAGTAGILLGMNAHTTNGWAYRFAAAPTSDDGGVFAFRTPDQYNTELIPFFNYLEGTTYNVAIVADYSTGLLDAFVDGTKLLSGFAFWNAGASNVTTNELFFHLNGELGNANSVALDNIFAATADVPEPASLMVWSMLGLLSMGAARYRRPRSATTA